MAAFGLTETGIVSLVIASEAKQSMNQRHGSPRHLRFLAMTKEIE
jgi:hypothetical protein